MLILLKVRSNKSLENTPKICKKPKNSKLVLTISPKSSQTLLQMVKTMMTQKNLILNMMMLWLKMKTSSLMRARVMIQIF